MRVAAIDLGSVRVGVAISDELGLLAHPRPCLSGRDRLALLTGITELVRAEGVERVLVGLPRRMDGSQRSGAERARQFAEELARRTGVEVELVDERFTTREAGSRLREAGMSSKRARAHIDSAAAAVFLQSWLDGHAGALRRERGAAER